MLQAAQSLDDYAAVEVRAQHRTVEPVGQVAMNEIVALFMIGRYAEMERAARDLIQQYPSSGFAWKSYSTALQLQGKNSLHAFQQAAHFLPGDAGVLTNLGNAFAHAGRLDEAMTTHRRAVQVDPGLAEAHCNLANVLRDSGQIEAAISSCQAALKINPNLVLAQNCMGNLMSDLGHLEVAEASYRKALELGPDVYQAHCNLGLVLRKQGRIAESEVCCRRALNINPQSIEARMLLAELCADKGQFSETEALFREVISIEPTWSDAWAGIARFRKMQLTDTAWLAAVQETVGRGLPIRKEVSLRFALGKYFDDIKDFDLAFANYQRANELSKQFGARYDRQRQTQTVDLISRTCDSDWISRHRITGNTSARPVFIVGMPRSGTSLAEHILASHHSVYGAGELPFWNIAMANLEQTAFESKNSANSIPALGLDYLHLLERSSVDALRVIDKMPSNFLALGVIHAAFPNARIIHMQRNPIDTCLSINFQHFEAIYSYANDLNNLAHYYSQYQRMMEHWHRTLPKDAILDVPYEDLVNDQEGWTRKMLAFIDLPWDQNCIDFHAAERAVGTASNWQVRQKINNSSVNRWRNYEKFIKPCKALMELSRLTLR
jgi:tetratricopeptide (TPR) repeat protein